MFRNQALSPDYLLEVSFRRSGLSVGQSSESRLSCAACTAQYGGLDIMVANAGIVKGADFLDMSEEDFDAVINVNLKGVFLARPSHPVPSDQRRLLCSL